MSLEQHEQFLCPHCGSPNTLFIDFTEGENQEFVVDCEVCCAPIAVSLKLDGENVLAVEVKKENE